MTDELFHLLSIVNTDITKLYCLDLYRRDLRFCGNEIKAYHKTSGAGMMPFDLCFTSRLEWLTHFCEGSRNVKLLANIWKTSSKIKSISVDFDPG